MIFLSCFSIDACVKNNFEACNKSAKDFYLIFSTHITNLKLKCLQYNTINNQIRKKKKIILHSDFICETSAIAAN